MHPRRTVAAVGAFAAAIATVTALNPPAALAAPSTLVVTNPAPVSPPDNTPAGVTSQVTVAGQTGLVTDVDVTLNGVTSTYLDDIDVVLAGPNGKIVTLMSDACGGTDVTDLSIKLDDEASAGLPDSDPCVSGSYFPSSNEADDPPFPAPNAPALSAFDGSSPNGNWTLYVADDAAPDTTTINGGFTLTIQVSDKTAPTVTFPKKPKPSTKTTQKVSFTTSDTGSTFECNLDGVGWNPCKSPVKLKHLSVGKHKLSVRATDPSGNEGAPAKVTVKVLPKR